MRYRRRWWNRLAEALRRPGLAAAGWFLAGWTAWAGQNYFIRTWHADDGLPQNAVSTVTQTRDGYLWIGTYSGLARFDGVRFVIFNNNNTPAMYSSRVTALFEDSAGNLWIGYEGGGLARYWEGAFFAVKGLPAWNGRKVLAIGEDQEGNIWALGADGAMLRIRDRTLIEPPFPGTADYGSLLRDRQGRIWVFWSGKIFQLQGDRLVPVDFGLPPGSNYIQGACVARAGGLWIMAQGLMRRWEDGVWADEAVAAPWGGSAAVTAVVERRGGGFAAGIVDNGVSLVQPDGSCIHFSRTNGLSSDWVRSVCEDREGNVWLGTGNGLGVLRPGKVASVEAPDGWQGRAVLSVCPAGDGSVWIGTEGAGIYHYDPAWDRWRHYGSAEGLPNLFIWSLAIDPGGRLWAGTWGGGLVMRDGDRFRCPAGLESLTVPVLALLPQGSNNLWIGTETGLGHFRDGEFENFGHNAGLIFPDVRCVARDAQGTVWFGMMGGGLGILSNGSIRQLRHGQGLSSEFVQCLEVETNGNVWVGTFGGGLSRYRNGSFAGIGSRQGLPNDVICSIEDDERGYFWFSSHGGIFRVSKDQLNRCADGELESVSCLSLVRSDGLETLECSGGFQPASCRTPDGRLWFPTSRGLTVVDPKERRVNYMPPPVEIEDLLVDGLPAEREETDPPKVIIPPGSSRIEIFFTALSLTAPEKVRFKYRLEGMEKDWVDAGNRRSATFSFLPPGRYEFRVIACNNDGIWNEVGQSVILIALPHFWQTLWFKAGAGTLLVLVVGGLAVFETSRRMRWKVERLQREQAVERERARIAKDIHDDLGASLTRITLLSQSARSQLDDPAQAASSIDRVYSTAHDLTRAMDEIVWAVNPAQDTLESLAGYLGKFAQDFLGAAGISCRLDFSVELPPWPLGAEARHNLFLAFKEVLNNIVKHAGATEVRVSLSSESHLFTLCIEDNGRGFDPSHPSAPDQPADGNGVGNIQRRLREIGGRCDLESSPGRGTRVRFIVPVAPRRRP
ncbi:MAG: two-component regulator propeller domain-containing protein [Verrucomicrobiota bacterium]